MPDFLRADAAGSQPAASKLESPSDQGSSELKTPCQLSQLTDACQSTVKAEKNQAPYTSNFSTASPSTPEIGQKLAANLQEQRAISAFNIVLGEGTLLATCSVKIGSVTVHNLRVRQGRRGSVFVNLPHWKREDLWFPVVEITSPALRKAVQDVVLRAVLEATR